MANKSRLLVAAAIVVCLSACGGGGGSISSTPTPTPSPTPTPTPVATIDAPTSNASFATSAFHGNATYDLATGTVTSGSKSSSTVQISYDAGSNSYTLSSSGTSQSFGPSQATTSVFPGERRYQINAGSVHNYLTLVAKPYTGGATNQYVGLGYWERISVSGATQTSNIDFFTYGSATPGASVPRQGNVGYKYDIFGLLTVPTREPQVVSGAGALQFDLQSGAFHGEGLVSENSLTSTNYATGYLKVETAGMMGSGNAFSGYISYTSTSTRSDHAVDHLSGDISGLFYGPAGEEVGASFGMSSASSGAIWTGAMTGQKDTGATLSALTLTNMPANTTFNARMSEISILFDTTNTPFFRQTDGGVQEGTTPRQVTLNLDGSFSVRGTGLSTGVPKASFTSANRSAVQRANFTSYDTNQATLYDAYSDSGTLTGSAHFDAYKIGTANPELQLTYVSFGIWSADSLGKDPVYTHTTTKATIYDYLLYGAETPKYLLNSRTGSATYQGVVYGNTVTSDGALQDVGGASHFNVDFGAQSFSGSLDLTVGVVGGAKSTLGTWTFSDHMVDGQMVLTQLAPSLLNGVGGPGDNSISPRFYGPTGEEIGATFSIVRSVTPLSYPGTYSKIMITGVTVAKKQ